MPMSSCDFLVALLVERGLGDQLAEFVDQFAR